MKYEILVNAVEDSQECYELLTKGLLPQKRPIEDKRATVIESNFFNKTPGKQVSFKQESKENDKK